MYVRILGFGFGVKPWFWGPEFRAFFLALGLRFQGLGLPELEEPNYIQDILRNTKEQHWLLRAFMSGLMNVTM